MASLLFLLLDSPAEGVEQGQDQASEEEEAGEERERAHQRFRRFGFRSSNASLIASENRSAFSPV